MKCLHCHNEFTPERVSAKFCSPKCRTYHSRGIKHKPNLLVEEIEKKSAVKMKLSMPIGRKAEPIGGWDAALKKTNTPPHLTPEVLKLVPRIFPPNLPLSDLKKFLHGGWEFMGVKSGGIKGYNSYVLSLGMPWRATTVMELEQWLVKSGYDPKLAKGVGYEPTPIPIEQEDESPPPE